SCSSTTTSWVVSWPVWCIGSWAMGVAPSSVEVLYRHRPAVPPPAAYPSDHGTAAEEPAPGVLISSMLLAAPRPG
ncbi:MAG: hypothetical protein ACTH3G_04165, partial [Citricoccus sp.]